MRYIPIEYDKESNYDKIEFVCTEFKNDSDDNFVIKGVIKDNKDIIFEIKIDTPISLQIIQDHNRYDIIDKKVNYYNFHNVLLVQESSYLDNFLKDMSYWIELSEEQKNKLKHLMVFTFDWIFDILTDNIEIVVRNTKSGEVLCEYRKDF